MLNKQVMTNHRLVNKTWGEIRMAIERRAKNVGVSAFNVIVHKHDFTPDGIVVTYQDKHDGKFHNTLLRGWTHQ